MKNVVIIDGARTAIGTFRGSLKDFSVTDLGAIVIEAALKRAKVGKDQVDEVIMGCVGQVAEDAFMARRCAIKAGIPAETSTAFTVNRLCSSGLQAIVSGMMSIQTGDAEIVVAGGGESMSNLPFYIRNGREYKMGHQQLEDGLITALTDPFSGQHMGITAENVAEKYSISREDQDKWALRSQQSAAKAIEEGVFKDEIVPVHVKRRKEEFDFDTDEHVRPGTTLEKLAKLRPAFKADGTVTAGNASGMNDGATAVVMMSEDKAKELGLVPKLRIVAQACGGVDPSIMGTGPIVSTRKCLERAGMALEEIDEIELNEAFAAQTLACIRELGMDESKVNIHGSGISIGHPIGCTGAMLTVKLLYSMPKTGARYGLETLCIGGGQGLTVIYERI